jgi:hypothetical protein
MTKYSFYRDLDLKRLRTTAPASSSCHKNVPLFKSKSNFTSSLIRLNPRHAKLFSLLCLTWALHYSFTKPWWIVNDWISTDIFLQRLFIYTLKFYFILFSLFYFIYWNFNIILYFRNCCWNAATCSTSFDLVRREPSPKMIFSTSPKNSKKIPGVFY